MAENSQCLGVINHHQATHRLNTLHISRYRRARSAQWTISISDNDGFSCCTLEQGTQCPMIVLPENPHRCPPTGGALYAPARYRIRTCVEKDAHAPPGEKSKQVPKQVERRRRQEHPFTTGQRRQFPFYGANAWRRLQCSRFAQRQLLPSRQAPPGVLRAEV